MKKAGVNILSIIKTKKEATAFIASINKLIETLFNVKADVEKKMDELLTYTEKEKIMALCHENEINLKDAIKLQEFLIEIRKKLESAPVISITLAFDPKEENIKTIHDWLVVNLQKDILLDIVIDKSLVGGAVVAYNGIYKDYSVRKRLEEKFGKVLASSN